MSKVIINKKYGQTKLKQYILIGHLLIIIGVVSIVLLSDYGHSASIYLLIPFIIFLVPGYFFCDRFKRERLIHSKNNAAMNDLSKLPEKYTVMRNIYIPYRNKVVECDFVVIGENGIFIIEVNGLKGRIYESKDLNFWLRYMTRRKSKVFVKPLANQKNVVDNKVLALVEYLQRFKMNVWIQGIVYFSSKKTQIELINYKGVFDNQTDLNSYINNFPAKTEIDELRKEKIEKLLHLDTISN